MAPILIRKQQQQPAGFLKKRSQLFSYFTALLPWRIFPARFLKFLATRLPHNARA